MKLTFLTDKDSLIELGQQAQLSSLLSNNLESGRIYHFVPVGPLGNTIGLNISCFLFYYENVIEILDSSTFTVWQTDLAGSYLTKIKQAVTEIDSYFNTNSGNPVQNRIVANEFDHVHDLIASLSNSLMYETGKWNGGNAWYTEVENYGSYRPYSSSGTYEKIGCYCTLNATVEKVEGWQDIYYNLPVASYDETIIEIKETVNSTDITYTISTCYNGNQPVIKIHCNNGAMERGNGYSDTLTFTIKYRYKLN